MDIISRTSLKRKLLTLRSLNAFLLLLITLTGAVLRFYKLGYRGFWYDEAGSVLGARGNLYNLAHPPLSFVILRIVIDILGTNEFTARLPACLFGIATIPLTYLLGKQLFGEKEGMLASFIISVSQWYVIWSQQARMYTELTVFTILAFYFFYKAVYKENLTSYMLSDVFAILAFYTHYSAILIVVIIACWLILRNFFANTKNSINYKHLMLFFVLFFVLTLPLFFITIPQSIEFKFGEAGPTWGEDINEFLFFFFRYSIGPMWSLFSIFGAIYLILQRNNAGYLLAAYATIPLVTFAILSFRITIVTRYLIFTLPAYALLASYLIIELFDRIINHERENKFRFTSLKNLNLSVFLAFAFLFIIVIRIVNPSALHYYYFVDEGNPDWKSACAYVASVMEPEDLIATTGDKVVYYYLGKVDYRLSIELFEPSAFEEIKNSDERVWLIIDDGRIRAIDPDHDFRDWIASDCELMKEVYRVKVYLFSP